MDARFLKGAAAEYVAASWFLRQGYEVWWPSVQQSRVDFLARRGRTTLKVQVKSARWCKSVRTKFPYLSVDFGNTIPNGRRLYQAGEIDRIVAVDGQRLWIFPFRAIAGKQNVILERTSGFRVRKDRRFNPDPYRVQ